MKIGLPEHTCNFSSPHRNWRYCKRRCGKTQYNYSGSWEDKITIEQFISKHVTAMGNGKPELRLEIGTEFEYDCYESWGNFFIVSIKLDGEWVEVGKSPNLNAADWLIRKTLAQTS